MTFLLDANAFIEPAHFYYDLNVVPGYWKSLVNCHMKSQLESIERIKAELLAGKDDLSVWVSGLPETFFKPDSDAAVVTEYSSIMQWVYGHPVYSSAAKSDFASGADGWLVAYAKVNGCTVVTQEILKPPETKKHVAIPNVCAQFGVHWNNVYQMFRTFGVTLDCPSP